MSLIIGKKTHAGSSFLCVELVCPARRTGPQPASIEPGLRLRGVHRLKVKHSIEGEASYE